MEYLQRTDLLCGHDHGRTKFSFETVESIREVLAKATEWKNQDLPLLPRFDYYTWNGEKVMTMDCRDLDSDEDLNVALFESIAVMNAIGDCYCVFYYVPAQPVDGDLLVVIMQVDTSRHLGVKSIYKWAPGVEDGKHWAIVDGAEVIRTGQIKDSPDSVWQSLIATAAHDGAFDFELLHGYLGTLGYTFTFHDPNVNEHNIVKWLSHRVTMAVRDNALKLIEQASGVENKVQGDINGIEVIE